MRIRLARFGRRNVPFYRIFVADSRAPRDGKHLEVLGHYDPIPGEAATIYPSTIADPTVEAFICLAGFLTR